MPAYNRAFLTEDEKDRFTRRLSHYLEDHLHKNKITHAQAAEKLGISPNKFSQLKSGIEQGRFLTSLDYIKSLAKLENMPITEFISFLDGDKAESSSKLYSWQDKIYRALEHMGIGVRKKFADGLLAGSRDSNERAELMCRAAVAMGRLDKKALESLVEGFEKVAI